MNHRYVELYCDEQDGLWKLTIWSIPCKDFDPFTCDFENIDYQESNVLKAIQEQRRVAEELRRKRFAVHTNTADPRSYFSLVPKWIVELIAGGSRSECQVEDIS